MGVFQSGKVYASFCHFDTAFKKEADVFWEKRKQWRETFDDDKENGNYATDRKDGKGGTDDNVRKVGLCGGGSG